MASLLNFFRKRDNSGVKTAPQPPFYEDANKTVPFLEVRQLTKYFPGGFTALDNVSFTVQKGECIVAGGANGSGKSLLMAHIAGLSFSSSGAVLFRGVSTEQRFPGGDIGLIFQDPDAQILGETPREDVELGPKNLKLDKAECVKRTETCLAKTGLTEKAEVPSRFLSGGEKRRLAVAGVLAMNPELIIFDEPFANLDWPGVVQVCEIIDMLKKEQKTLIILTHELEKALAFADRFLILYRGKLVFDGTPEAGLNENLENWGIRHPLRSYTQLTDLTWQK